MKNSEEQLVKMEVVSKLPAPMQKGIADAFQKCITLIGEKEAEREISYAIQIISKNKAVGASILMLMLFSKTKTFRIIPLRER